MVIDLEPEQRRAIDLAIQSGAFSLPSLPPPKGS
jgi:hypothetical protein